MAQPHAQLITGLITLAVLGLVVRRTLRTQRVRVWALIALPLLMIGVAGAVVGATPPTSAGATLVVVAGAVAGAALGYARGRHSKVQLGARPGTIIVQGNVLLVAILLAAFAVRFAVRSLLGGGGLGLAVSDAFIVFAAASIAVARGMLFVIWRRLVAARTASPA